MGQGREGEPGQGLKQFPCQYSRSERGRGRGETQLRVAAFLLAREQAGVLARGSMVGRNIMLGEGVCETGEREEETERGGG